MKESNFNWPIGLRKTKSRVSVLAILEDADKPLSATCIWSKIETNGENTWLSTIYRVLDSFVEAGLAIKITVLDNEMTLFEINRHEHKHYAICLNCHKILPMNNCPMDKFNPSIDDSGFQITGHKAEVYGYCKECIKNIK